MLPTAELHLHIEGTLEPELLVTLARRNEIVLPTMDVEELRAEYLFDDLQSFLNLYYRNVAVLRTEQDFYDLGISYFGRAAAAGVRRAEVFFDPQQHLSNGVALETVLAGLTSARQDAEQVSEISSDLILCFLRDLGPDAARDVLEQALPFADQFIGVGLDSAEVGYPPAPFADVFARAGAAGLRRVAHAGEEGGPDYVLQALDILGVERIDHGIRSMEDPELVARLRDEQIPLTVCPMSNVSLKAVASLADHPLPAMLDAGLLVTVNSDDPAYFGGYIDDNYAAIQTDLALSDRTMVTLAENSFKACFATDEQRAGWLAEVAAAAPA